MARALVSLPIMMCWQLMWLTKEWALSALRTRVCTSHRNGYRVVCELGTIETFGLPGGLRAIVREKDALLGAVIDGEEGEAEWVPGGNRPLCNVFRSTATCNLL